MDGTVVLGRVLGADDEGVDLAVAAGPVRRGRPVKTKIERLRFADVARAVVQIEFGPAGDESAAAGPVRTDADVDLAEDAAGDLDGAGFQDALADADEIGDELDDGWADDGWPAGLDELDVADDQHGADDPGDARRAPTAGRRKDVGGSPGEETDR